RSRRHRAHLVEVAIERVAIDGWKATQVCGIPEIARIEASGVEAPTIEGGLRERSGTDPAELFELPGARALGGPPLSLRDEGGRTAKPASKEILGRDRAKGRREGRLQGSGQTLPEVLTRESALHAPAPIVRRGRASRSGGEIPGAVPEGP